MKRKYILIVLFLFIIVHLSLKYFKTCETYTPPPSTSSLNVLCVDNNGNLSQTVLIASGTIALWNDVVPPIGWALCDGTNGTPDLRGKFIVGSSSSSTDATPLTNTLDRVSTNLEPNSEGGEKTNTISLDNIPSHTHSVSTVFDHSKLDVAESEKHNHYYTQKYKYTIINPNDSKAGPIVGGDTYTIRTETGDTNNAGEHIHTLSKSDGIVTTTMQSVGNGNSHSNLPPYVVLSYIMKL